MDNNLVGKLFGRLLVVEKDDEKSKDGKTKWICKCIIDGNVVSVIDRDLKAGKTKSCGCIKRENTKNMATTHGMSSSPEYGIWCNMKSRCYNPNSTEFHRYGNHGIGMCGAWRDSFEAFYRDMGPRPSPEHSIDRIENNKGYFKANCRWATKQTQSVNRRNVTLYDFKGDSLSLAEIARICNIHDQTLRDRVKKGMSIEEAVATEVRVPNRKYNHNGLELTLREWSEKLQINYNTLVTRIVTLKIPVSTALNMPAKK